MHIIFTEGMNGTKNELIKLAVQVKMLGNDGYLYLLDQETPYIWNKFIRNQRFKCIGRYFTISLLDAGFN